MTDTLVAPNGFLDRTRGLLRRALADVVNVANRRAPTLRPNLPDDDLERLRAQIDDCLEASGGEVEARANAATLGRTYLHLNAEGRRRFFALLAEEYGVNRQRLNEAMQAVQETSDENGEYARAVGQLRTALEPPRLALLRKFNSLERGIKFVIDMRADLEVRERSLAREKALADEGLVSESDWHSGLVRLEALKLKLRITGQLIQAELHAAEVELAALTPQAGARRVRLQARIDVLKVTL